MKRDLFSHHNTSLNQKVSIGGAVLVIVITGKKIMREMLSRERDGCCLT